MVARRAVAAGAAAAVALAGSLLSGGASADDAADSCSNATISAGAVAGVVGAANPEDWWRQPAVPGWYLVTLASGPADADLSVGDAGCSTLCASAVVAGADVCSVRSTDGGITIGVQSLSEDYSAYTVTVTMLAPSTTECSDRIDNDGDGVADYPGDAGCSSAADTSEDDSPCTTLNGNEVCYDVVKGALRDRYSATVPGWAHGDVVAYLRFYRFNVMGVPIPVPCVDVVAGGGTVSACKEAHGRFTGSERPLYDLPYDLPDHTTRDDLVVRVCDAVLTVTVNGNPQPPVDIRTTC